MYDAGRHESDTVSRKLTVSQRGTGTIIDDEGWRETGTFLYYICLVPHPSSLRRFLFLRLEHSGSRFTIGTRCRPILHFIPRGWPGPRGEQAILLDVTLTLSSLRASPSILRLATSFPPFPSPSPPPLATPLISTRPPFLVCSHSDRKGLQMAAISACIDSWNWEDLLVSGNCPDLVSSCPVCR